jgi:hypothetical protein
VTESTHHRYRRRLRNSAGLAYAPAAVAPRAADGWDGLSEPRRGRAAVVRYLIGHQTDR